MMPGKNTGRYEENKTEHNILDVQPVSGILDNGLKYVIDRTESGEVVSVVAIVKAGSIYEKGHLGQGLSHFCEHMVHEGETSKHTGDEYTALVEKIGNNSNAYTTKDHTLYFINTTVDHWEEALQYITDWMFDCTFTQKEYDREYGVIQREIEKGDNEPGRIISKAHYENMFQFHPVRYPVIGYIDAFRRITRNELYAYYKRMYVPHNIVFSISGPVSPEKVLESLKNATKNVKPSAAPSFEEPREPQSTGVRTRSIVRQVGASYMSMGFHSVTLDHPDLFALDVLSGVFSGGATSRMTYTIKEKKSLAFSIYSYSYTPIYNGGIFGFGAVAAPQNIPQIENEIWTIIDDVKKNGVTEDELRKVKKQIEADHIKSLKTPENRAKSFGRNYFFTGSPMFDDYYVREIQNVTAEQVQKMADKYLDRDKMTVTYLGPVDYTAKKESETAAAQEEKTAVEKLENGVTLLSRKTGHLPLVDIEIVMQGGSRLETKENAGISGAFSEMLLRGSKNYSRDDILEFMDSTGSEIGSMSGRNTVMMDAEVLSDQFDTALLILADALKNPAFPEGELEKIKTLTLQSLESENDNWQTELGNAFREEIYRVHPYGNNPKGTKESLKELSVKDIRAFYSRLLKGENVVVGVYGDIPDGALEKVRNAFSKLPAGSFDPGDVPAEPDLKENIEKTVSTNKKGVAGIYMGYHTIDYNTGPEGTVFDIIDAMTSGLGYPGGWLHSRLRGEKLVYVVHAFNVTGIDPGYFGIYAGCDPENIDKSVSIIKEQMARLEKGDFTDEEFKEAADLCILTEKMRYQTVESIASRETIDTVYGLGTEFHTTYEQRIRNVKREDIQAVAKKYFQNYVLVITKPEENPE